MELGLCRNFSLERFIEKVRPAVTFVTNSEIFYF